MKDKINTSTILGFAKGKYSYTDYLKVKNWFANLNTDDEINEHLYLEWSNLVDESSSNKSLIHIFDKIQYNILKEEKEAEKEKISWWNLYRKIAAVLLIPVLAFFLWYYFSSQSLLHENTTQLSQSWIEINAPNSSRIEFSLPDGSHGWLNSGSKLKYLPVFGEQRKVELTGEAWFDVEHIEQSSFIVSVSEMDVKVLGTKFNVSAYDDDDFTSVILEEGKVEIQGKNETFTEILQPNQKIAFDRLNKSVNLKNVNAQRFSAWKEGYFIIDNETLGQVENRIERWYNVKIELQDEELRSYRYKATFKDEPLEEVLRLLSKTAPISYKIERAENGSNNTVKQRIVTIKLKK